jgi:hypothetical protein
MNENPFNNKDIQGNICCDGDYLYVYNSKVYYFIKYLYINILFVNYFINTYNKYINVKIGRIE